MDPFPGRHEAYYKSKSDQSVIIPSADDKVSFLADEMIQVEVSYKVNGLLILLRELFMVSFSTPKSTFICSSRKLNYVPSNDGWTALPNILCGCLSVHHSSSLCCLPLVPPPCPAVSFRNGRIPLRPLVYHRLRIGRTCGLRGTSSHGA